MPPANEWRCGKDRYHEAEHGEWVRVTQYKREKWRCGVAAQAPPAIPQGIRFECPWTGCSFLHPDSGPARGHWYTHIRKQNLTFSATHGTEAGYSNHRRLKEPACEECKKAHSEYVSRWQKQWRRAGWQR